MKAKLPKLVRDRIPVIIEETGSTCMISHVNDHKEHQRWLVKKMQEEVDEFINDPSYAEAADILEVIKALCYLNGLEFDSVLEAAQDKYSQFGGFYSGTVLEYVDYRKNK